MRDALQDQVSRLERFCGCGRKMVAGAAALTSNGTTAGWSGTATCGSVHVCPVCQPVIRRVRAAELNAAGRAWESVQLPVTDPETGKEQKGTARGLVMGTLTMRHYKRQSLGLLVQRQREAWKLAFGQNALRTTKRLRKALGVTGYVRAWETTHGANGWHVHFHVAIFLEERPDARRVRLLERLMYRAWADALERVGAYRPSQAHAVRVDAPAAGTAGQMAQYLMKDQGGKWGAAEEMTLSHVKQGRKGHRMPMEIARGAADGDEQDIELWQEFEEQATGIRSLYWSQGLRARLEELVKLDKREDVAVAAEENAPGKPLALFPRRTWYGHVVRHKGRRLQLIHAAEKWSTSGVRTLVTSWGLLWGIDVLEPDDLPEGAAPTLDEVLRGRDRAELSARADVWRREFARQEREQRLGRVIYQPNAWEARREAQKAADEQREQDMSTAPERERLFREGLRRAKQQRPAAELQSAMSRFRSAE